MTMVHDSALLLDLLLLGPYYSGFNVGPGHGF